MNTMPRSKRPRRDRTDDWQRIQQYTLWPEQKVYELLRPVVLFNETAAERAQETGTAERTLYRKAEQFEEHGMASLFPKDSAGRSEDKSRSLPPDMRQLIVDLHADLQANGVRCWFAPEDLKIGEKIRPRIDEAIHLQDKLLLLLSEYSIASDWVADEVEAAIEKEQRQKREVLFPVGLDDAVTQAAQAWAAKLRRSTNIGDFTRWKDPQAYQQAFEHLLRDLKKTDERQDQEMRQ